MNKADWKFILKDKYNDKITKCNVVNFIDDMILLSKGYPRDYIIGYVDFLNCHIDLSYQPLIPRVETEYWLEKILPLINQHFKNTKSIKTLDIFAGSGCIGIAVAKNIKKATVDFSDIDQNNIKQIKKNITINKVKNFKKVTISDIFSNISGKYDLILANPPYVPLSNTIKAPFEPPKAIVAGKYGLDIIEPFIAQIKSFLNKGGLFAIEHHPNQVPKIKTMLKKHGFKDFEFFQDQYNRPRYVVVKYLE